VTLVAGYDSVNYLAIPAGSQAAGYTTGTGIAWPPAGWVKFPTAIRICQDAGATDTTADVLDVESGAATLADVPVWFRAALDNYHSGKRPGQRYPTIYCSQSNVTAVANALVSAGITTNGPALWIADWSITQAQAEADVTDTGPYPIIGYQFADPGPYDKDVWLESWLTSVSVAPVTQVSQPGWEYCRKCGALFYGPFTATSVCPAGGTHDGTDSYNFTLQGVT
jgi:hypothetical protein